MKLHTFQPKISLNAHMDVKIPQHQNNSAYKAIFAL